MAEAIVTSEQATSKSCSKCGVEKALDRFGWTTVKGKKYRKVWCKRCCNDYAKEYKKNPPPKRQYLTREEYRLKNLQASRLRGRRNNLKRKYNLTEEEYQTMLNAQGGVCAICRCAETRQNQYGLLRLSIDHDHTSGMVRGLLCRDCNIKLFALEDKTFVEAATAYIDSYI